MLSLQNIKMASNSNLSVKDALQHQAVQDNSNSTKQQIQIQEGSEHIFTEGFTQRILYELGSSFQTYFEKELASKLTEIEQNFNELQRSCEETIINAQHEHQQREEYIYNKFQDMRNFQSQIHQNIWPSEGNILQAQQTEEIHEDNKQQGLI
eukprot:TRINITY_DN2896_c0_g1_i3.p1 TRINITY_DN2896_c0_g1~~TRINITY_DN2896_c0_g1_i3.p1  ORF type:complete len:152 (-),score=5.50 TRINITY_DN2896_c0_g1_i3:28-483(-)